MMIVLSGETLHEWDARAHIGSTQHLYEPMRVLDGLPTPQT
jgi:hypothetical protein